MSRPKGSLNANKQRVMLMLEEHQWDPIKKLVEAGRRAEADLAPVAVDDDLMTLARKITDAEGRIITIAGKLAEYAYPKLKAVELSADPDSGPLFQINGVALPSEGLRTDTEAETGA